MSSAGDNLAVVHNDDFISILYGRYALGDYDFCGFGYKVPEGFSDKCVCRGVDCACGVVENKYFRLFKKRSGDTETLLLAA